MKNKLLKKIVSTALCATMVAGLLAGCGGSSNGGGSASGEIANEDIKIGVSIWSSTDVLGSQCKLKIGRAHV